jgi:ABC-type microcin C transport system permease subunit YejB
MATNDVADASIPQLITGLVGDAKDMAAGHASKARDEIKEEFSGLKQFLMMVLVSIGLGIMGAILLSQAFALGLAALGMPMWAGYLIAAVIFIGIGIVLVKRMPENKDHIDLFPESAIAGMKRDVQNITDDVKDEIKDPGRPVAAH